MSFTAELSNYTKGIAPRYLDTFVRKVVIEIGNRLVYRSPVGNPDLWKFPDRAPPGYVGGRFRANWQYGFNTQPQGDLPIVDASGQMSLTGITSGALGNPTNGITFIVNNLPYGEAIENGHSTQAPHGIIGLTEMEFPAIVAMAKR